MNPDDLIQRIQSAEARIKALETNTPLVFHTHTGYDMNRVRFADLDSPIYYVQHTIIGTAPATTTNYSIFWIAPAACVVTLFKEVHTTAGSDGSAVTIQLEKLTGTTSPGSGSTILTTALSLKATANTVQTGSLTTTLASKNLAAGDRLALKLAGTPTAVANVTVLAGLTF